MEFVHGRSVREILNANGPMAPAQATDVLSQTLAALTHAPLTCAAATANGAACGLAKPSPGR